MIINELAFFGELGGSARMEKSWMERMGRNVAEMLSNIRI